MNSRFPSKYSIIALFIPESLCRDQKQLVQSVERVYRLAVKETSVNEQQSNLDLEYLELMMSFPEHLALRIKQTKCSHAI
jgi:hypothetical protein